VLTFHSARAGYSFCVGFTKVGVVVMFLHDVCDPWLEAAKMTRYAGMAKTTNTLFVIFTMTWIAMRDVYFPGWVIRSALFDAWGMIVGDQIPPKFPHWQCFTVMLIVLWVLHLFWTYVILRIAVEAVTAGELDDTREKRGHQD
jgi:TLC domain